MERCDVQVRDRCAGHLVWVFPGKGIWPRCDAIYYSTLRQQVSFSKVGFKIKVGCVFYRCYLKSVKCSELKNLLTCTGDLKWSRDET